MGLAEVQPNHLRSSNLYISPMEYPTMANRWTKLADLTASLNTRTKTLTVVPYRRPYISQTDAVYDYHVGHEFTVVDPMSPLYTCHITVCDRHALKETYGITHLSVKFNPGFAPVEVAL